MSQAGAVRVSRTYQDALRILRGRRRPGRPSATTDGKTTGESKVAANVRGIPSINGMYDWLKVLGHTDSELRSLNVIHVAGTKGKGTTCALTEALLRIHGKTNRFPKKTGMYTSPHLVLPEERIRLDAQPISQDKLAKYFFDVYDGLKASTSSEDFADRPRYLQLWALTAFHAFIQEQVQVAVIETHHGGEYDATNFIKQPQVAAITTLGMDHVEQLGPGIKDVAWHKSGIFKANAAAISAPQVPDALEVLRKRAADKGCVLEVADQAPIADVLRALPADVLRVNASVAVAAANAFLRTTSNTDRELSQETINKAISSFSWPGRFQQITKDQEHWYLDSAHNLDSMAVAADWYARALKQAVRHSAKNVLLFSHMSKERDWQPLMRKLLSTLKERQVSLASAVLTTYRRRATNDDGYPSTETVSLDRRLDEFAQTLHEYFPDAVTTAEYSIDKAVQTTERLSRTLGGINVLVTGSQHLVGGVLECIQSIEPL